MISHSRVRKIHFSGIGGAGMSGIAEVLNNMGFEISGSDIQESQVVERLRKSGIKIHIGHRKENVDGVETLVYSSAITRDNVEVKTAVKMKIPVIPRAEMLAELMRVKFAVAVAGTHGKTSTTSMIASILNEAKKDPTYVVGGKLKTEESGAKLGKSEFLVAEADESDGSFLKLFPTIAVITNIEDDHLDHYGSFESLKEAFTDFGNKVPFFGSVAINIDCPNSKEILSGINKKVITFGVSKNADIRAKNIVPGTFSSTFNLVIKGIDNGKVHLNVGGHHNVLNSLAAISAALESGIDIDDVISGLSKFSLPDRRFQVLYRSDKILIVDDYAHHPTEIKVTLDAIKIYSKLRVIAVFQPHRFTRLESLMEKFSKSFENSDIVVLAKLYSANQKEIEGVSSGVLADLMRKNSSREILYIDESKDILSYLQSEAKEGDAIVFLSAGDLTKTAHSFAKLMEIEKR
ncbi:MAG: UDP-N-acetylmuramate--L-alanine ligase [Candidatus Aminicenantes bacterium]|nr:UDP-N-acetylmuramate--L-alanine ligase [Candidatus Aminicenantes bacterium]